MSESVTALQRKRLDRSEQMIARWNRLNPNVCPFYIKRFDRTNRLKLKSFFKNQVVEIIEIRQSCIYNEMIVLVSIVNPENFILLALKVFKQL